MKVQIIRDGLTERTADIDAGSMVVHPRDEWARRFKEVMRRDTRNALKMFTPISSIAVVIVCVFNIWTSSPWGWADFVFILALMTPVLALYLGMRYVLWSQRWLPTKGLYQRGIMTYGPYVPYEENEEVEEYVLKNIFVGRLTYLLIRFRPAKREGYRLHHTSVETNFLGPDGVRYLMGALKAPTEEGDPPKLVVYRDAGGVAKEEYVPDPEDA